MFFKNDSKYQIGLRTKKEVLTINPGDCVHIFDSDIINLSSNLTPITEAEFNKLTKKFETPEPKSSAEPEAPKVPEVKEQEQKQEQKQEDNTNNAADTKKEKIQKKIKAVQEQISKLK